MLFDDLDSVPGAVEVRHGLPRLDWNVVTNWTWTHLARLWLEKLAQFLPRVYEIRESDAFLLLCQQDDAAASHLLRRCEKYRDTILQMLKDAAWRDFHGKHVVLAFQDWETYYDYISDFYPDKGDFGGSAGILLTGGGYVHIVLCMFGEGVERTLAHEMVHLFLCHLPLPLWLNEGVTQVATDLVLESSRFLLDPELAQRHRAYWSREKIDGFWSGESFYLADEGQELSYSLAEVLVRNLLSDHPQQAMDIVRLAHFRDAGDLAFQQSLGVGLADRVAQFLGPGDWQPHCDHRELDT